MKRHHPPALVALLLAAIALVSAAIAADPAIDLARAVVIGDSASDLQAGNDLGVPAFLVGSDRRQATIRAAYPRIRVDGAAPMLLGLLRSISTLDPGRQTGQSLSRTGRRADGGKPSCANE
jgi:beta-phosphoglucomutase-like phosphatase (HAD superfamily)